MDNLYQYSGIFIIVLGSVLILFISKKSIFDKICGTIGYIWMTGFIFFGMQLGLSGIKWLIAIFPGFGIMIYFKYKEMKNKKI